MTKPGYSDRTARVECYVDHENEVAVILPSDVWLTAEQAENFGKALIECAAWVKANGKT